MLRKNTKRTRIKDRKNTKQIFLIFLMLSFAAFMSYHVFLAVNIASEKMQILEIAQEDVAELRMQNLELVLEKSEVVSMEYIEKEARDKLRYAQDGEVLFLIQEDLLNSEEVREELVVAKGVKSDYEDRTPEEIFQIWMDFLFSPSV